MKESLKKKRSIFITTFSEGCIFCTAYLVTQTHISMRRQEPSFAILQLQESEEFCFIISFVTYKTSTTADFWGLFSFFPSGDIALCKSFYTNQADRYHPIATKHTGFIATLPTQL